MKHHKQNIHFGAHLILIAASLIVAGCATRQIQTVNEPLKPGQPNPGVHAENEAQTKFGIFLTVNPFLDTRPGRADLASVPLVSTPVLSEKDVISYDFSTHTMKLRPEALARIPTPVHGLPFVVVADGQRIYMGAFWTEISSMSTPVPTIIVDKYLVDKTQATSVQVIDRAYPSDSFGEGPDPRGDPRIKSALAALHKLQ